jgi:hypothetical protein
MLGSIQRGLTRPALSFWVSEGFAPGLMLAGVAPAPPEQTVPDEVDGSRGRCAGGLLRWVFPDDIADAP